MEAVKQDGGAAVRLCGLKGTRTSSWGREAGRGCAAVRLCRSEGDKDIVMEAVKQDGYALESPLPICRGTRISSWRP